MTTFKDSLTYSNEILSTLRHQLAAYAPKDEIVIVCGSYSRGEASKTSDIDYFTVSAAPVPSRPLLTQLQKKHRSRQSQIKRTIKKLIPKGPANGGAFSHCHSPNEILNNIGGQDDDNDNITRRILFLLEGSWLTGENGFRQLRRKILRKYISPSITDHQLALFLLNDIIRYYRTVCVDYEFKTVQAKSPKPWAIRNVKLIFSRKLLYASGLFSVALTCDRRYEQKIRLLEQLFDLPSMERLSQICGSRRIANVMSSYDRFLTCISDNKKRSHLEKLKFKDRAIDPTFRDIKNEGHLFTRELNALFHTTFDPTHPIHKAVIF